VGGMVVMVLSRGSAGPVWGALVGFLVTTVLTAVVNALDMLLFHPAMMAPALSKLAVAIGGRKRAWRSEEWAAGSPPGKWARIRHSAGLVVAAVRWRVGDLLHLLGRLLDWTLAEPRTEVLIVVATVCGAAYFWRTQGLAGLMGNFENVLATAVLTSGPGLWLRKHRGVPPARRRKREVARR
jgi:hypothetical protein